MPNTTKDKKVKMEVAPFLKRINDWGGKPYKGPGQVSPSVRRASVNYAANKNKKIGR